MKESKTLIEKIEKLEEGLQKQIEENALSSEDIARMSAAYDAQQAAKLAAQEKFAMDANHTVNVTPSEGPVPVSEGDEDTGEDGAPVMESETKEVMEESTTFKNAPRTPLNILTGLK